MSVPPAADPIPSERAGERPVGRPRVARYDGRTMAAPRLRFFLAALIAMLAETLGSSAARAEPRRRATAAARAKAAKALQEKLASMKERIESGGEGLLEALAEARALGAEAAPLAPTIEALLKGGATVPVMLAAIETCAVLRTPSSSAPIGGYLRHRSPALRHAAVRALPLTGGPEAVTALREGLRTNDEEVRGAAAEGLGQLGAEGALEDLYQALERGLAAAAPAIGALCKGEACEGLARRADALEAASLAAGFDEIFFRPSPLPEEVLVRLVERLRAHGRQEVDAYLARVASRWPATGSPRVARALAAPAAEDGGT
nr:HEAT repeat domain-containing protein [Myxococcales bacterium]